MFARVVAKLPVPLPVTSHVRVIVWSPVFVPLEVPENVPDCVASVPRPRLVRAVLALVRSERLFAFTIKPERSWSPVLVQESVPVAPSAIVIPLFCIILPVVESKRAIALSVELAGQ